MAYNDFASVYDRLMQGVDYPSLCEKFISLARLHSHTPQLVLDAACGTGAFTFELIKRGCEVIGVDCSEDMLSVARERLGSDALLLCQLLSELDLYGTIDTVFCTLDGLNHIIDEDELLESLQKISLFLEPNGYFLFDVNTEYKHEKMLSNNTFVLEDEGIYTVWQNSNEGDGVTQILLDFFVENDDGSYDRFDDCIIEKAYSDEKLTKLLEQSDFEVVGRYDFEKVTEPKFDSEKIIYVCKKKG